MALTLQADLQDNAASTTLVASTGTSGTLTNAGNTSASTTTPGPTASLTRAILFDGSNDYGDFTTGNTSAIRNSAFGFIGCWAKCDAISSTGYMVFLSRNTSASVRVALGLNSSGQLICESRGDDFESVRTKTSTGRYLGKWHHFAALVDLANDAITLYVDGQAVASTGTTTFTATAYNDTTHNSIAVGAAPTGTSPFPGAIAGVRTYNSNESSNLATIIGESAPVVTSGDVSVTEGRSLATTAVATSVALPTWSVTGGADASLFTIDRDGRLQFKSPKYHASPADADTNNVYVVEVTATNAAGSDAQTLNVTVAAGNRTGMLLPQSATSATYHAHYDCMNAASFGGNFPNDRDSVATFTDVSGVAGVNLAQSTAAVNYLPGEANGGGCLRLADNAQLSGIVLTGANWTTYTIKVVVKPRRDSTLTVLSHSSPARNLITLGRSSGYATFGASTLVGTLASRDAGYAVLTNIQNGASDSVGVPPGAGVRWINGSCYGSVNGAGTGNLTAGGTMTVGAAPTFQPDIVEIIIYRGALSVVENAAIDQHLMDKWGITAPEPYALVCLGNSMTTGDGAQWPTVARNELFDDSARNVELYNLAQTGGTSTTLANQSAMFDELRDWLDDRGVRAVLVMWHGHNDGTFDETVTDALEDYPAPWRAGGHRAMAISIGPTAIADSPSNARQVANEAWFDSDGLTYFDALAYMSELEWADEASDPLTYENTLYNADGLHLVDAGYTAVGEWMAPKILTQLEAFDEAPASGGNSNSPAQSAVLPAAFSPSQPPLLLMGG